MTRDTAADQALVFRAGVAELAEAIATYAPTLVIYFGPDHRRAMTETVPCFTVVEQAAGFGDWGTPTDDYDVPGDQARLLARHLLDHGIDIAFSSSLRLDHGFALSMCQVFGSLGAVRTIPIVINCIDLPMTSMARVALLGQAVNSFLRQEMTSDDRVLILGSGGLSHSPPTLIPGFAGFSEEERAHQIKIARDKIAPGWDAAFLRQLASGGWRHIETLSEADVAEAGPGANEIRTWVAAAFAGGQPLVEIAYEPVRAWITGMAVSATASLMAKSESFLRT